MDFLNVTVGLAFLAGLASFLTPCVFSLVPVYIGYLGGRSAGGETDARGDSRWVTFSHGLAFVLGFSLVFVFLGVATSVLGRLLYDLRIWLTKIGGLVVIIFGLHMIGIFRIPFLDYDVRVHSQIDRRWGYLSSAMMGVFFSAGWSPCIGPVLGAILTIVLNGGSVVLAAKLLAAYSTGLAIPFLIAALGIGWVTTILRRYSKAMHYAEIAMGVLLVIVGIMLFRGTYTSIANYGYFVDFGL